MTLTELKRQITEQLGVPDGEYGWVLRKGVGSGKPMMSAVRFFSIAPIDYDPLLGPRDYAAAKPTAEPVKAGAYKVKDRSGSSLGIAKVLEDALYGPVKYRLAGQSTVHTITLDEWNKMSPEPSRWA